MMGRLFDLLFGCTHPQTSFPLTLRRAWGARRTAIVCTDCGAEFEYNWATMRRGRRIQREPVPGLVERARAAEHYSLTGWEELT